MIRILIEYLKRFLTFIKEDIIDFIFKNSFCVVKSTCCLFFETTDHIFGLLGVHYDKITFKEEIILLFRDLFYSSSYHETKYFLVLVEECS